MIGTQVGPLRIMKLLGEGGMGKVFLAEHTVLKTKRAVKLLLPELTQRPAIVQRFVNEARAAAKLLGSDGKPHRNLIQVHDIGQLPDGSWFMVLDYLEGGTLARFIASNGGAIAPHLVVHVVAEIANGLKVAHANKIVHRDLKPENIFLSIREADPHNSVILDFGVAQLGDDPGAGPRTRTGMVIGTPAYMPPEQLRGEKNIGPAADIFALGTLAYQMATGGWLPYQGEHEARAAYYELPATEIYLRQMTRPPVDPRRHASHLSEGFARIILAAIDRDPSKRPASAPAFALKLAEQTPTDGVNPDGLELVRTYARELLDIDNMLDTVRGPRPATAPDPASKLESKYQLGAKLGAGGMAEVFLASTVGVEGFVRQVAIKRVLSGLSETPAFANMFIAEAQIAARLSHPNIVPVLDFSRDPEDRLFLVMEYVDGKDLAAVLDAGPLSPSLAIYVISEMLRGLGCAHDLLDASSGKRGIVHRDVSPHNLLLSFEGAVKVSDFGLAKALEASGGVRSDTVRGKPAYMSPEQVAGEPLDGRSDLFAAGIMLHELLTHDSLFRGTAKELMAQVLFKHIPSPEQVRSRVDPQLAAVAMKLLARDRNDRYATAEAAIADLLRCPDAPLDGRGELVRLLAERFPNSDGAKSTRHGSGPSATPRQLHAAQITVPEPTSTLGGAASQSIPRASRRRAGRVVGVASAVAVGGAAVLALVMWRDSKQPSSNALETRASGRVSLAAIADAAVATAAPADPPRLDAALVTAPADAGTIAWTRDAGIADAAEIAKRKPDAGPSHFTVVPTEKGDLTILVDPWADVWIDGRKLGSTPVRTKVGAGVHRVVLINDVQHRKEDKSVTVAAGKETIIDETW